MQQHKPYGGGPGAVPFAAGVCVGVRGWNFNPDAPGLLESPTPAGGTGRSRYQWIPGENIVSQCSSGGALELVYPDEAVRVPVVRRRSLVPYHGRVGENGSYCPSNPSVEGRIDVDCACGFYGTTRVPGGDIYGDTLGIIEGYGLTLIGSVGFRVSKARIVALARGSVQIRERGPVWPQVRKMLEDVYSVPVYDELRKMLIAEGWTVDQTAKQVVSPQPGC